MDIINYNIISSILSYTYFELLQTNKRRYYRYHRTIRQRFDTRDGHPPAVFVFSWHDLGGLAIACLLQRSADGRKLQFIRRRASHLDRGCKNVEKKIS